MWKESGHHQRSRVFKYLNNLSGISNLTMERTTCKWALHALPTVVPILEEGFRSGLYLGKVQGWYSEAVT